MTNPFGGTLQNIRTAMSGWTEAQTVLGAGDATAALARIFLWAAPPNSTTAPPRITLVGTGLNEIHQAHHFQGNLIAEMLVEAVIPVAETGTFTEKKIWFVDNVVDPLLNAMEAEPLSDGGLMINARQMTMEPGEMEQEDNPTTLADKVIWAWQHQMSVGVV